jgi:hypothetical protein
MGIHKLTKLTTTWTWEKLPPSSYSILYAWLQGLHPNVILSKDSQVKSFEILEIRTLATLEAHKFLCKPLIEVELKAKL